VRIDAQTGHLRRGHAARDVAPGRVGVPSPRATSRPLDPRSPSRRDRRSRAREREAFP
jgi:hypothetical protein